ncbi:G-protein coupled receptor moody [Folsomia candida]|uniref:G-protein coupled receptor moody n=1 Tax=Folsomia candida TaxID=158441 RepID=UPI000B8F46C0|nr:G-protein coupled receptor moody [Folsomia candida]XP_021950266.1 G-protein coupled receptor moody [Folsomia candida]
METLVRGGGGSVGRIDISGVGGGDGEISDSNYSDQPLEPVIGLSLSLFAGTILDNGTNESTFGVSVNDDDLFPEYPVELTTMTAIICVLFLLLGIPGNLITIIALARCKKVRNATAYFIINLSACDLMFCCFNLPLAASMFWHRKWIHGDMLCGLFPFFRYGLMAVSVFTVLAITINRYVMIGHPRVYPRFYRTRNLAGMIFFIWMGAFGALFPTLLGAWGKFMLDREIGSCSIMPDESQRSPKEFLFIVAFLLPCCAIIICYARIFLIVRKATVNSRPVEPTTSILSTNHHHHQPLQESETLAPDQAIMRRGSARPSMAIIHQRGKMTAKDRKLLWMILVIFGSFVICYLPITCLKAIKNKSPGLNVFGLLLIYLTTCMNPCIYVVMSSEYRQAYKSLILCRKDWNLSSRTSNSNKT